MSWLSGCYGDRSPLNIRPKLKLDYSSELRHISNLYMSHRKYITSLEMFSATTMATRKMLSYHAEKWCEFTLIISFFSLSSCKAHLKSNSLSPQSTFDICHFGHILLFCCHGNQLCVKFAVHFPSDQCFLLLWWLPF